MPTKKTTLSRLKDGQVFILSFKKGVSYKLIKKEKDGYVFTSNNSNLSFKRSGKTVVYLK